MILKLKDKSIGIECMSNDLGSTYIGTAPILQIDAHLLSHNYHYMYAKSVALEVHAYYTPAICLSILHRH